METSELYADIVLPLAKEAFTYRVDTSLCGQLSEGMCVEAELGRQRGKVYTGVVWRLHNDKPPYKNIRSVQAIIKDSPVISTAQMRFWEWMSDYYMCTIGEVMKAALPSALKPNGFSREQFDSATYKPLTDKYYKLHPDIASEDALNDISEKLRTRAKKQYDALMAFIGLLPDDKIFTSKAERSKIDAGITVLNALEKKRILVSETVVRNSNGIQELPELPQKLPGLSPLQTTAVNDIRESFGTKDVSLLHGITGSGKTEIYIHLIAEELAKGRNVLYLLPEIAMTSQLIERVRDYFGERVVTYHSSFPERHRIENFLKINRSKGGHIILGVRSAIFLPAENLGLVIVDEEHDGSYKNNDSAPRYHGRDSAVVLSHIFGAKTLLGSATPSLESYSNAVSGKYGLAVLPERYGDAQTPGIIISDTIKSAKRGERKSHFNKILIDRIGQALADGEQVMLFQNRRGFSPYVECGECGWTASCDNCNVTLTYHKSDGSLRCHYCGSSRRHEHICPSCRLPAVEPKGFGTEKIEEELAVFFPEARIERLDRDTATSVKRYNAIISSFGSGQTDILIGTQMITKGFDFDGVSLVGILNADNLLAYPDFRASERAFQLMTQVAGRAGRRAKQGTVIIQTSQPGNHIIQQVAANDYTAMFRSQMDERKTFFYPPYCRLISITLKHRDRTLLWHAANTFSEKARKIFGRRIVGPMPPPVDRIRGEYLLNMILKVERDKPFAQARRLLTQCAGELKKDDRYKYVTAVFNVDPQ